MKISVVIPVYNTKKEYLLKCLDSVFSQTIKPYEIIVVDDGSSRKETLDFLSGLKGVKLIRQENKGISGALNTGIKAMTGDWWAGLASDDEWLPIKLEEQIKHIIDNPNAKFIYSDWITSNDSIGAAGIIREAEFDSLIKQQNHLKHNYFPNWSGWLIKKEVFDKIGLFNESFIINEDYEFVVRASLYYLFYKVSFPLFIYRIHQEQLTSTNNIGSKYRLDAQTLARNLYNRRLI